MNTQADIGIIQLTDRETYHRVFMEFYASLCRYAETILTDSADAEDVVADVFFRLWHQQKDFREAEHLKAHLYRATKNACIDFLRTDVHQGERNAVFMARSEQIEQGHLQALVHRELLRDLYAALESLSEDDRQIIRLGYLEGYTNQELADLMGLALQTVKNKKLKAMARLRKRISREQFHLLLNLSFVQLLHQVTINS